MSGDVRKGTGVVSGLGTPVSDFHTLQFSWPLSLFSSLLFSSLLFSSLLFSSLLSTNSYSSSISTPGSVPQIVQPRNAAPESLRTGAPDPVLPRSLPRAVRGIGRGSRSSHEAMCLTRFKRTVGANSLGPRKRFEDTLKPSYCWYALCCYATVHIEKSCTESSCLPEQDRFGDPSK